MNIKINWHQSSFSNETSIYKVEPLISDLGITPLKSILNLVYTLKIVRNATAVATWDLHCGRLRLTLTLHTDATACNSPLGACLSQRDWIAIAADDFTTRSLLTAFSYFISVFVLYTYFQLIQMLNNILFCKRGLLLLCLSNFFVFWPQPGFIRVRYEGFYCSLQ